MSKIIRIGDKVEIICAGNKTGRAGEVVGVGHTMYLIDKGFAHGTRADAGPVFIVRLDKMLLITPDNTVIEGRGPSNFPGSMAVFELALAADQLQVLR